MRSPALLLLLFWLRASAAQSTTPSASSDEEDDSSMSFLSLLEEVLNDAGTAYKEEPLSPDYQYYLGTSSSPKPSEYKPTAYEEAPKPAEFKPISYEEKAKPSEYKPITYEETSKPSQYKETPRPYEYKPISYEEASKPSEYKETPRPSEYKPISYEETSKPSQYKETPRPYEYKPVSYEETSKPSQYKPPYEETSSTRYESTTRYVEAAKPPSKDKPVDDYYANQYVEPTGYNQRHPSASYGERIQPLRSQPEKYEPQRYEETKRPVPVASIFEVMNDGSFQSDFQPQPNPAQYFRDPTTTTTTNTPSTTTQTTTTPSTTTTPTAKTTTTTTTTLPPSTVTPQTTPKPQVVTSSTTVTTEAARTSPTTSQTAEPLTQVKDNVVDEDVASRHAETEISALYRPGLYSINNGQPFYLSKDPVTGDVDFNTAARNDDYMYDESLYEDGIDRKDGKIEAKILTSSNYDKTNPFNNLPLSYNDFNKAHDYNNHKYSDTPLISSSYANTKVQGAGGEKQTNHRPYHVTSATPSTKYYTRRPTTTTTTPSYVRETTTVKSHVVIPTYGERITTKRPVVEVRRPSTTTTTTTTKAPEPASEEYDEYDLETVTTTTSTTTTSRPTTPRVGNIVYAETARPSTTPPPPAEVFVSEVEANTGGQRVREPPYGTFGEEPFRPIYGPGDKLVTRRPVAIIPQETPNRWSYPNAPLNPDFFQVGSEKVEVVEPPRVSPEPARVPEPVRVQQEPTRVTEPPRIPVRIPEPSRQPQEPVRVAPEPPRSPLRPQEPPRVIGVEPPRQQPAHFLQQPSPGNPAWNNAPHHLMQVSSHVTFPSSAGVIQVSDNVVEPTNPVIRGSVLPVRHQPSQAAFVADSFDVPVGVALKNEPVRPAAEFPGEMPNPPLRETPEVSLVQMPDVPAFDLVPPRLGPWERPRPTPNNNNFQNNQNNFQNNPNNFQNNPNNFQNNQNNFQNNPNNFQNNPNNFNNQNNFNNNNSNFHRKPPTPNRRHEHLPNILPQFRPNAKPSHYGPGRQPMPSRLRNRNDDVDELYPQPPSAILRRPFIHRRAGPHVDGAKVTTLQMIQQFPRQPLKQEAERPVFVVYPTNTKQSADKEVVVGVRGPHLPVPPPTLDDYQHLNHHQQPLLQPARASTTRPPHNDFPYALVEPEDEDDEVPTEAGNIDERIEAEVYDNRPDVSPYLQDYMPFATKTPAEHKKPITVAQSLWSLLSSPQEAKILSKPKEDQISVTLKTVAPTLPTTPTPDSGNRQQAVVGSGGSEFTLSAVMHTVPQAGNPVRPPSNHNAPSRPPANHNNGDDVIASHNFQAPFMASTSVDSSPVSQGWNIVPEDGSPENKLENKVDGPEKSPNFDFENFKPQLFGGFKPIYSTQEETKHTTEREEKKLL